jgi:hypothetical protein
VESWLDLSGFASGGSNSVLSFLSMELNKKRDPFTAVVVQQT